MITANCWKIFLKNRTGHNKNLVVFIGPFSYQLFQFFPNSSVETWILRTHIAVIRASGTVRLFINGTQVASQPVIGTAFFGSTVHEWTALQSEYVKFNLNIAHFQQGTGSAYFVNKDYEPAAIARDQQVSISLEEQSIDFHSYKDHVIFEHQEVLTGQGGVFYINVNNVTSLPSAAVDVVAQKKALESQLKQYAGYSTMEALRKSAKIVDKRRESGY